MRAKAITGHAGALGRIGIAVAVLMLASCQSTTRDIAAAPSPAISRAGTLPKVRTDTAIALFRATCIASAPSFDTAEELGRRAGLTGTKGTVAGSFRDAKGAISTEFDLYVSKSQFFKDCSMQYAPQEPLTVAIRKWASADFWELGEDTTSVRLGDREFGATLNSFNISGRTYHVVKLWRKSL